eukprot:EG_transcript_28992
MLWGRGGWDGRGPAVVLVALLCATVGWTLGLNLHLPLHRWHAGPRPAPSLSAARPLGELPAPLPRAAPRPSASLSARPLAQSRAPGLAVPHGPTGAALPSAVSAAWLATVVAVAVAAAGALLPGVLRRWRSRPVLAPLPFGRPCDALAMASVTGTQQPDPPIPEMPADPAAALLFRAEDGAEAEVRWAAADSKRFSGRLQLRLRGGDLGRGKVVYSDPPL